MLKYNWANISSFCFSTEFIKRAKDHLEETGQYHIAKKKIPSILGPVQVMRRMLDQKPAICCLHGNYSYLRGFIHWYWLEAYPAHRLADPAISGIQD